VNSVLQSRVPLRRQIGAIAWGILVGVALTTMFEFTRAALFDPPGAILPPSAVAEAAFLFSTSDALVIICFSVPIWLLATRLGLESPLTAAILGFIVTLTVWTMDNYPPLQSLRSGLPYAIFGGIAGLTIWWTSRRG
jgi:hypothetical protein